METLEQMCAPSESLQERNERQREIDRKKDEGRCGGVIHIVECDICRRDLADGEGFHQMSLGMNEAPYFLNGPIERESAVESTTEMVVCTRCEPKVTVAFDAFLATLWTMRAKDPDELDDEPTVRMAVDSPAERGEA